VIHERLLALARAHDGAAARVDHAPDPGRRAAARCRSDDVVPEHVVHVRPVGAGGQTIHRECRLDRVEIADVGLDARHALDSRAVERAQLVAPSSRRRGAADEALIPVISTVSAIRASARTLPPVRAGPVARRAGIRQRQMAPDARRVDWLRRPSI
jgi:hypothetical protein